MLLERNNFNCAYRDFLGFEPHITVSASYESCCAETFCNMHEISLLDVHYVDKEATQKISK